MLAIFLLLTACSPAGADAPAVVSPNEPDRPTSVDPATPDDPFEAFLAVPIPVADGLSSAGSGWSPCGAGCWEHAGPGVVRAIGAGRVVSVQAGGLVTEHLWYEDEVKHTARAIWSGVDSTLAADAEIRRGQEIGRAERFTLVVDDAGVHDGDVDAFIHARGRLPVPQAAPVLALVSKAARAMQVYVAGQVVGRFEVGFGQSDGVKERRGDNRTPSGVYHVVARSEGPFDGDYAAYYGGYWIKLNYPNPWDAARGVDEGLIDAATQRAITDAWWSGRLTAQKTALGGGIGMHGWAMEWSDGGDRRMSWGCIVMHLRDAPTIFGALQTGAMVVVF